MKLKENSSKSGNIATTMGIEGPGPQRAGGRQRVNFGI